MSTTAPPVSVARPMQISRPVQHGLIAGVIMAFIAAIGLLHSFDGRQIINPILSLGYLMIFSVPFVAGYLLVSKGGAATATRIAAAGGAGLVASLFPAGLATLVENIPTLRGNFPNLSPAMVDILTFGEGASGLPTLIGATVAAAVLGGGVALLPRDYRMALAVAAEAIVILAIFQAVVRDMFRWFTTLPRILYESRGGLSVTAAAVVAVIGVGLSLAPKDRVPSLKSYLTNPDAKKRTRASMITAAVVAVALIGLPQLMGGIINELLTNVGLFLLMALGLNIVVGLAGLLDLGYVAFFAVGAYTMALLTSPISPRWAPMLSWWEAFPFVIIACMIAGLFVGTPVIRMRGDYLAIVTLGFGEIVRLTLLSDWMSPYFGGAQGIRNIPGLPVFGAEVNATRPGQMVYAVIFFVLVAAYITWRVQDSRLGRAWAAIREDEDVAEAIGVDTVKAKLLAFITGATLAGFAGALFAAKVGSVFTNSFEIIVSIVILVIVIVGGMGNIAGVAVGALVLIGVLGGPQQPGLLQEFGEFKLLIYGALLIFMMLKRPEGLIPSARRAQELHQDEYLQDAWLDKSETAVTEGES